MAVALTAIVLLTGCASTPDWPVSAPDNTKPVYSEKLLEQVLFRLDIGKSGKADWGHTAFADVFVMIFRHIYVNPERPQFRNVALKEGEKHILLYDGNAFAEDTLECRQRLLLIVTFIGNTLLKWMASKSDMYTKKYASTEEKCSHIDRVLTGIPRFKTSYEVLFRRLEEALVENGRHYKV